MSIYPLVMGLPIIDQNLENLITQLSVTDTFAISEMQSLAKTLGLMFALIVASYECWMMILGKRGLNVLKLLRIVGLSMCISFSTPYITTTLAYPGEQLTEYAKVNSIEANKLVAKKELEVAQLQEKYAKRINALNDSIRHAKQLEEGIDYKKVFLKSIGPLGIAGAFDEVTKGALKDYTKQAAVAVESKMNEWISMIVRFLGEVCLQVALYGLLVLQIVSMRLLELFLPITFALSILPPWSSAWSQWISKYITISLWSFIAYFMFYYVDGIMLYTLSCDEAAYTALIGNANGSWAEIGQLGMQGFGTTIMYLVAMLVGAKLFASVPEVASWLIPGGVSSSSAGVMAAAAGAAGGAAAGAVTTIAYKTGEAGAAVATGGTSLPFTSAAKK